MTTKIVGPSGTYPSIRQAAIITGLSRDAIAYLTASEIDGWRRTGPVPPPTTGRPVIGEKGTRFASVKAAARAMGVPHPTMRDWCMSQRRGWRYEDEPLRPKGPRKAEGFDLLDQLGPIYADDVRVRSAWL